MEFQDCGWQCWQTYADLKVVPKSQDFNFGGMFGCDGLDPRLKMGIDDSRLFGWKVNSRLEMRMDDSYGWMF